MVVTSTTKAVVTRLTGTVAIVTSTYKSCGRRDMIDGNCDGRDIVESCGPGARKAGV